MMLTHQKVGYCPSKDCQTNHAGGTLLFEVLEGDGVIKVFTRHHGYWTIIPRPGFALSGDCRRCGKPFMFKVTSDGHHVLESR